jgi:hypothetical protein
VLLLPQNKIIKFILSFIVIVFFTACSSTGTDGTDSYEDLIASFTSSTHIEFPHGDDWSDPEEHGTSFLNTNKYALSTILSSSYLTSSKYSTSNTDYSDSACFQCHDSASDDNTSGGPPGCKSCHTFHLTDDDWINEHPSYVNENGGTDACASQCHGETLSGGLSEVSCTKCHLDFPTKHKETDWETKHGKRFLGFYDEGEIDDSDEDSGSVTCSNCHGTDLTGGVYTSIEGNTAPSCFKCHASGPHINSLGKLDSTWKKKENHAAAYLSGKDCTSCHGDDYTGEDFDSDGELDIPSCYSCHPFGAPHQYTETYHKEIWSDSSKDWKEAENHGPNAEGSAKKVCAKCHGSDYTGDDIDEDGTNDVPSCYKCHAGDSIYPHSDTWTDDHQSVAAAGTEDCQSCHGTDLTGGLSDVSCNDACHDSDTYPHDDDWETGHQSFGDSKQYSACSSCHNLYSDEAKEGSSAPGCRSCHYYYPHEEEWNAELTSGDLDNGTLDDDETPANLVNDHHSKAFVYLGQKGSSNECKRCHGDNYDEDVGTTTKANCKNCHQQTWLGLDDDDDAWADGSMNITHASYTDEDTGDEVEWSAGGGHGKFFSTYFSSIDDDQFCKKCHGAPIPFYSQREIDTSSENDCYDCHYVSSRTSNQTKDELTSASFCYSCHWKYPHKSFAFIEPSTASSAITYDGTGNVSFTSTEDSTTTSFEDVVLQERPWGPTDTSIGGDHYFYKGHVKDLINSPLTTTSEGYITTGTVWIPGNGESFESQNIPVHSCAGGSEGSCHYNGKRGKKVNLVGGANMCMYCHTDSE